jgi:pimeloyl-ACP methyl ester carboxylesterase
MPIFHTADADLHYEQHGCGDVPFVFGHGTLISAAIWRDLYFPLLPPEWRAYALDFRGHGESRGAQRGCTFVRMAEDVRLLAQELDLGRFIYVGLSMGGGVGLQLALRHPDLLRGLVLLSPVTGLGPIGNPAFRCLGTLMAGRRWLLRPALAAAATRRPSREELERVVDQAVVVTRTTLREYLSRDNRIEGIERLASLRVPTLLVIGGRDRVIPVAQQERLGEILPNCTTIELADEGHAAAAEVPARILHEIRAFVGALPRTS